MKAFGIEIPPLVSRLSGAVYQDGAREGTPFTGSLPNGDRGAALGGGPTGRA